MPNSCGINYGYLFDLHYCIIHNQFFNGARWLKNGQNLFCKRHLFTHIFQLKINNEGLKK